MKTYQEAFEQLGVWEQQGMSQLSWYRQVAANRMPAKFRIAERVAIDVALDAPEDELWAEIDAKTPVFLERWEAIRSGQAQLSQHPKASRSLLALCSELSRRMLRHCNFCRWDCGVDRAAETKFGTCKLGGDTRVSTYFHHRGEELVYRGTRGSGTIFFTSCNLRCSFCLHPESSITTPQGPRRIADLYEAAGQEKELPGGASREPTSELRVLSRKGTWVVVKQLFKRQYQGYVLQIEPCYGPALRVTPSHEIPSTQDPAKPLAKVPAELLQEGDFLKLPRPPSREAQPDFWAMEADAPREKCHFGDDGILVPIQKIQRVAYEGPVYNLEVNDEDHTYTANHLAVGNCQNGDISTDKDNGTVVSARSLATMAWLLRMEGCHNINWVGGEVTIHLHTIVEAIELLATLQPQREDLARALPHKADFLARYAADPKEALFEGEWNAPMLWNSNFFMSAPAMKILRLLMDVWLPDFKFGSNRCAISLARTPWYWETVTGLLEQISQWGEGMTIRHLVMPEHVECCTLPVLQWIAENIPEVPVNIMDQYHPDNFCDPASPKYQQKYEAIARYLRREELQRAYQIARELEIQFEPITFEP